MPILVPEPAAVTTSPPGSSLIVDVWDALPEYVRDADEPDGTLYAYLDSACNPAEPVVQIVTSGADMVDPALCPTSRLDWVAALAGIDLTGVPESQRRAFIGGSGADTGAYGNAYGDLYESGGRAVPISRFRGNRSAIVQRVGLTLTGAKTVQIECPYEADPMKILVRTFTAETPDEAVTEAAIRAEVPAWLALTVDFAAGIDYDALNALFTDYDDMTTDGGSYNDLSNIQP